MKNRNKLGSTRARLAVAAAVLIGGGAASLAAVAASHGPATTAQSAGYTIGHHRTMSESSALTAAFSGWGRSRGRSLTTLASMRPVRTFSQSREHHTMLAMQRGIVVLATRKFLVIRSANGSLHLWWLTGGTQFLNVSASTAGMGAMTGSSMATNAAMLNGNMTPATTLMAGSTQVMNTMTAPMAQPATMRIGTGGQVITISITRSTATVTQQMQRTTRSFARNTQPAFLATRGVARGDLVFVAGWRRHGSLLAKIVLFAAPGTTTVTPSATPSMTVTQSTTVTPTMPASTPTMTSGGTGAPTFSGAHS